MLPNHWQLVAMSTTPALLLLLLSRKSTMFSLIRRILTSTELEQQKQLELLQNEIKSQNQPETLEEEVSEQDASEVEHVVNTNEVKPSPVHSPAKLTTQPLITSAKICFTKVGVLTHMDSRTCQLDFTLVFNRKLAAEFESTLNVGCSFWYLAYRSSHDSAVQLVKLLRIENELWDTNVNEEMLKKSIAEMETNWPIQYHEVSEATLQGSVVALQDGTLLVDTEAKQLQVPLPAAQQAPRPGDLLTISAVFQQDMRRVDGLGEMLELLSIKPLSEPSKLQRNDKRVVELTCNSLVRFESNMQTKDIELIVANKRSQPLRLAGIELLAKQQPHIQLLEAQLYTDGYTLTPYARHSLRLRVKRSAVNSGKLHVFVHFEKFTLRRSFEAVYEHDDNEIQTDNSKQNYAQQVVAGEQKMRLPGQPVMTRRRFVAKHIERFEIPAGLRKVYLDKRDERDLLNYLRTNYPCFAEELNFTNYTQRFRLLLQLEELAIFASFRQYDCENARFLQEGEYLALLVENLQERRPSLVIGDMVRLVDAFSYDVSGQQRLSLDGAIHKVLKDRIFIKFHPRFHSSYNDEAYRLEFHYSRYGLRKLNHSVGLATARGEQFLFPNSVQLQAQPQCAARLEEGQLLIDADVQPWYNNTLNVSQKRAVCQILRGEASMPYCIFGPPGTGKTVTVVETVLQLLKHVKNARLLVAAPSNSAADLIATRLIYFLPELKFVRIIGYNFMEKELIPPHLSKYCATVDYAIDGTCTSDMTMTSEGVILHCTAKHLRSFHLVIGTCSTLGNLMQMRYPDNHFTHAIIDEAAQCLEPEFMSVAVLLSPTSGQVILSGDPKQLAPLVISRVAEKAGLSCSYMERLLEQPPYMKNNILHPDTNGYDKRLLTMLIYNYRALPSILAVYNYLFYDNELIAVVRSRDSKEFRLLDQAQSIIPTLMPSSEGDPPIKPRTQGHATFFCGMQSRHMQDDDSPSWYNLIEAKNIFLTTLKLLSLDIHVDSIGIISPYVKQVRHLRSLFQDADLDAPKIGTIEEFQGQERDIVLVSTVRSTDSHLEEDLLQSLGFLSSPKRINVAVSRARIMLIVFGNPQVLCCDEYWRAYIMYCYDNSGCYGDKVSMAHLHNLSKNKN